MSQSRQKISEPRLAFFPYGVSHDTGGVCLLLYMGVHRILLDCGLGNIESLTKDDVPPADLVLCSHAHEDHAQGLLALHKAFPQLPIYGSAVTTKLLFLNWQNLDSQKVLPFCRSLDWRSPFPFSDRLTIELFPAGHLPGAASIFLKYQTRERSYNVFYTGDFSVSNFQLVEGLSIEALRGLAPDVLIVEASYGTARHPHRRQQEKQLMERINQALNQKQSVILPVPILGLGQEILKLLRTHHQFTGRDLDIWVEGKVAKACDIYLELLPQFPLSVQNFAKHQPLFWDEKVRPRMRRISEQQTVFNSSPCIIITDHTIDLEKYFVNSEAHSWLILLPETPRGLLGLNFRELATKYPTVTVETYLLAEHSDGRNTTQLIHNIKPQHVIFFHASPDYLSDLTSLEELQNRYQLHSPFPNNLLELPLGDRFIQPDAPKPTCYEGEINEQGTFINITLPDLISQDKRWQSFADTGLVEARWQGEELVIRGLSQRELLLPSNDERVLGDVDCCSNCRHQRGQRCWNQASPLYGFKITPDGYCPVFEPNELSANI